LAKPASKADLYAALRAVPEHKVAEIIQGGLVTHPRPAARHATAATALAALLFGPFRRGKGGPGGWVILCEPEIHLQDDVLVPDLAGWRRERMPQTPDVAAFDLSPDWICEIVSPSTEALDREQKLPIYANNDVRHAWLVDPLAETLEVFELQAKRLRLTASHRGEQKIRAEPFAALELELAALWER